MVSFQVHQKVPYFKPPPWGAVHVLYFCYTAKLNKFPPTLNLPDVFPLDHLLFHTTMKHHSGNHPPVSSHLQTAAYTRAILASPIEHTRQLEGEAQNIHLLISTEVWTRNQVRSTYASYLLQTTLKGIARHTFHFWSVRSVAIWLMADHVKVHVCSFPKTGILWQ